MGNRTQIRVIKKPLMRGAVLADNAAPVQGEDGDDQLDDVASRPQVEIPVAAEGEREKAQDYEESFSGCAGRAGLLGAAIWTRVELLSTRRRPPVSGYILSTTSIPSRARRPDTAARTRSREVMPALPFL